MSLSPAFLHAAITIAFGAVAGGITNAVAVWMLFHPYEPRGLGSLRIQGAIPKNKDRLAKTIGRTVGQRLLTADDLARQLQSPEIRAGFEKAVRTLVAALMETERGALRDELPPALTAEIERAFAGLAPHLASRLAGWAETPAFRDAVAKLLTRAAEQVKDRPLSDVLTAERREAIRERVGEWLGDVVTSPEMEGSIRDWLRRQVRQLASDQRPLLERLPATVVSAAEGAMAGYLPVTLERLAGVLKDPGARARIGRALHDLFERFANDLLIHQRIVAKLVMTEKTISRMLDSFERDGIERLGQLLEEPELRAEVARSVNDAVVSFLRRPLAEHYTTLGPDRVDAIVDTFATYVAGVVRDPTTGAFAGAKLDGLLQAVERRTWGDLLGRLPPEQAAEWLATAARSETARTWLVEASGTALSALLDRPLGRVADHLPDGSVDRTATQLAPALWDWAQRYVPTIVEQVDIASIVEDKVRGFSLTRLEELVRTTTQRELDLIVRLGYLLGAIVGAVGWGVGVLLG